MTAIPLVVDISKFKATGSWIGSLVPAAGYRPEGIGKTYWPPMNAKVKITAPMIPATQYANMKVRLGVSAPPVSFNWNTASGTGTQITPVQNQGPCGSCWAVSSSTAIGDQWAVATKRPAVVLSAMSLTNCTPNEDCVNGGEPADAAQVASVNGILPDSCWPYTCNCQMLSSVPDPKCQGPIAGCDRYFVTPNSWTSAVVLKQGANNPAQSVADVDVPATIELIKTSIMTGGPVVTGFNVPPDFMDPNFPTDPSFIFKSSATDDQSAGWHAVAITGWNVDAQGQLYWIIRNSWGTDWGYGGYFNTYAYPLNNRAWDIPTFSQTSIVAAERARIASIRGPAAAMVLDRDQVTGPSGGVTLWTIDLGRSPKPTANTGGLTLGQIQSALQSTTKKPWVKTLLYILGAVVLVALVYYFWSKSRKSSAATVTTATVA